LWAILRLLIATTRLLIATLLTLWTAACQVSTEALWTELAVILG
jgi:hypothetical protein